VEGEIRRHREEEREHSQQRDFHTSSHVAPNSISPAPATRTRGTTVLRLMQRHIAACFDPDQGTPKNAALRQLRIAVKSQAFVPEDSSRPRKLRSSWRAAADVFAGFADQPGEIGD